MIKMIGRRLVINWGKNAIAIEILFGPPASHGVPNNGPEGVYSLLQEINDFDGVVSYKTIKNNPVQFGRDANTYISTPSNFLTELEIEELHSKTL